jgi:hypothetical protein
VEFLLDMLSLSTMDVLVHSSVDTRRFHILSDEKRRNSNQEHILMIFGTQDKAYQLTGLQFFLPKLQK